MAMFDFPRRPTPTQTIAYTVASAAAANPFGSETYLVRLAANSACHVRIGDGAQTATTAKEPEWKTSRQLESVDQHVPAGRKQLFYPLLRCRTVWDVTEVGEQSFDVPAALRSDFISRATRFDENRKRRQHTLRVS